MTAFSIGFRAGEERGKCFQLSELCVCVFFFLFSAAVGKRKRQQ
jgi:hypothetical protein